VEGFEGKALTAQKELTGKKTASPIDAYRFLERMPVEQIAYLLAESSNSAALSKIRAYLNKWRPVRHTQTAVANELEALGMPRGQKFDQIVEQMFAMQLTGRGKTPEEREKILRKLSGIKEQPKKKEKEKKPRAEKAAKEKPAKGAAPPPAAKTAPAKAAPAKTKAAHAAAAHHVKASKKRK
jgi:hypothetical protein